MKGNPRVALYLRISQDRENDGLAVERQRDECHGLIESKGWTVTEVFEDQPRSAYVATVKRPRYDALVAAVQQGAFDVVVCWDLDRLTRQPRQLEAWIDLAEQHGVRLVTANGEADLATDGGRLYARVKAAVAAGEIERKSARQKAASRQRREKGLPPLGPRPFGFEPDRVTPREYEAEYVRGMYARILDGKSVYSIQRWLVEEDVQTLRGNDWSHASIVKILKRKSNAGLLEDESPSAITPLVDRETWDAAQRILDAPDRKEGPGRKPISFWLTGIATCGSCGAVLKASIQNGKPYYRCKATLEPRVDATVRHVGIRRDDLERIALTRILEDVMSGDFGTETHRLDRLDEVLNELQDLRTRRDEAQQDLISGLGNAGLWRNAIRDYDRQIEELADERDRLHAAGSSARASAARLQRLSKGSGYTTAQLMSAWGWSYSDRIPVEERRALARGYSIVVSGGRGPAEGRVSIAPAV